MEAYEYEEVLRTKLNNLYQDITQLKSFIIGKNKSGERATIEDVRDLETVRLKMTSYIALSDYYLECWSDDEIKDNKQVTEENLRLLEEGFIEKIVELARIKHQQKAK